MEKLVGPDGSTFIGTTRNGQPSGLGTCIWPDESQYDGEWKDGYMHGFGTYVWKSGQRYDGEWKVSWGAALVLSVAADLCAHLQAAIWQVSLLELHAAQVGSFGRPVGIV